MAEDSDVVQRVPLYERLLSSGTRFHPNSEISGVRDGHVTLQNVYSAQESELGPIDLIVAWAGRSAQDELTVAVEDAGLECHLIGDALAPRSAEFAITEGAMVGRRI